MIYFLSVEKREQMKAIFPVKLYLHNVVSLFPSYARISGLNKSMKMLQISCQ